MKRETAIITCKLKLKPVIIKIIFFLSEISLNNLHCPLEVRPGTPTSNAGLFLLPR